MTELLNAKRKNHVGTYKVVPKVAWNSLSSSNFSGEICGDVDWVKLYPINEPKGEEELPTPKGIMSPRQAAKLFYDGIHILEEAEKRPKSIQDRLPEIAQKAFKRKQWQKQFMEGCRRVCCRLAKGLEFGPNCVAEDIFVIMIMDITFSLGWRRIDHLLVGLPECQGDRDFSKIKRLKVAADVQMLWRESGASVDAKDSKKKKEAVSTKDITDPQNWFAGYVSDKNHLLDHVIQIDSTKTTLTSSQTATIKLLDELIDALPTVYEDLLPNIAKSTTPIVVMEAAEPYRITHINAAVTKMSGFTQEEILGNNLAMVGAKLEEIQVKKICERAKFEKDFKTEYISRDKSGTESRSRIRLKLLTSAADKLKGQKEGNSYLMGVLHDIEVAQAV